MLRGWLINKNLSLYYRLKHLIGKQKALKISKFIESMIPRQNLQENPYNWMHTNTKN